MKSFQSNTDWITIREVDFVDEDGNAIVYSNDDIDIPLQDTIDGKTVWIDTPSNSINDNNTTVWIDKLFILFTGPNNGNSQYNKDVLQVGTDLFSITTPKKASSIIFNWGSKNETCDLDVKLQDGSIVGVVRKLDQPNDESNDALTVPLTYSGRQGVSAGAGDDLASRVTFDGAPAFNLYGTSVVSVAKITEPGKYLATSQGTDAEAAVASAQLPEITYTPTAAPVIGTVPVVALTFEGPTDGFEQVTGEKSAHTPVSLQ